VDSSLGHGKDVKTIKDYALGGRNFSTAALVATIVATWASGSGFFIDITNTYSDGLYYLLAALCMGIQLLIMAFVLVPRMGEFLGSTSVAEAMGDLYGQNVRIATAIAGAIGSMGLIAVQFSAFGNIVGYFSGVRSDVTIIVAGIVVTMYSAMGGIRAVTTTDILQIFTFCFAVPLIGIIIWNQLYFTDFSITTALQSPKFNLQHVLNIGNPEFWQMLPLMFYFTVPTMLPSSFQRISMGSSIAQVKKASIIAAIMFVVIILATAWIPFLIFNVNPGMESSQVLGFIIDNYTYTGLKGLLIIGVLAMAMSTADSNMNISSVLFSHDICSQIKLRVNKELILAKVFSFLLGIGGIMLALTSKDLLSIVLSANSYYMPVVTVPLVFTILGFRSTKLSVLIAMSAGFGTVILWKIFAIETDPIIFGMLANVIFLFGSHYLLRQPGGWVGVKDKKYSDETNVKKTGNKTKFFKKLKEFNFFDFCKKYSPSNDLTYMGFGIYCIICTITTMYSTQVELLNVNGKIVLVIYQIMMITGTMLAMYPVWPLSVQKKIKERIVQVWWNPAVFYMLVLFSTFFVMVSNFNQLQFVIFTANTILIIILAGWKLAIGMIVVGFYASVELFKYYREIDHLNIAIGSPQFVFMYSLVLIGAVLVIFLKPKQDHLEATEQKVDTLETEVTHLGYEVTNLNENVVHYNQRISDQEKEIHRLGATAQKILNNVNHELRLPIGNVVNFAEMLNEGLEKYSKDQLKELSDEVLKNSTRLSSMILNMLDLATLNARTIALQKKTVNLGVLVEERIKTCRNIYLQKKKIDFELSIAQNLLIDVDPNYIRQTVDNLVINAITFSEKGVIKISVTKQQNVAVFVITNEGKPIPHTELYDIFSAFRMASNTESQAEGRGVGLALCKAAIEAHGGMIKAENTGKGAKFRFVLPL